MSTTLDSNISFKDLCNLFEAVFEAKGKEKFTCLQEFTQKCHKLAEKLKEQKPDADISLYTIFRLILPDLECDRGCSGLKVEELWKLYIEVFCLEKKDANLDELTNYKPPVNSTSKCDDFAEKIYWVMHNRQGQHAGSSLTVSDVNKFLDEVAKCNDLNISKVELFNNFMLKLSAMELKWLTRILLKGMNLELDKKMALKAIHPDAQELSLMFNLKQVCSRFAELHSADSQDEICVEIFSHVKPMLLERFNIEYIGNLFRDKQEYFVQTKFDGERSQLHMRDGRFKYFSRNGVCFTNNSSYGEFSDSGGFLTSAVAQLLDKNCKSIILDGELMVWDNKGRNFVPHGRFDAKKIKKISQYQPCFVAYDILFYNDENLMNKPYSERLTYLKSAFSEKEGVLMLCDTTVVTKVEQLLDKFNESVENNEEGIVIKISNGIYKPNVVKSGCYKIKTLYSDGLVEELDLIILGGYYGQGGTVNTFLVGVARPPVNENDLPSEFLAVVKVSSGLTCDQLKNLQQRFKDHWKDTKPEGVLGPKSKPPKVWIEAKNSVILEVRAAELIKSKVYPLNYSLKSAKILKIRDDKPWYNVCSTTEFISLIQDNGAVQKLTTKKKVTSRDVNEVENFKRVLSKLDEMMDKGLELSITEKKELDKLLLEAKVSPISLFRGKEGYFHDEQDVQKYPFAFLSGIIADEFHANVDYIFVDKGISADALEKYKKEAAIEDNTNSITIVNNIWIRDCLKSKKLLPPDDYII